MPNCRSKREQKPRRGSPLDLRCSDQRSRPGKHSAIRSICDRGGLSVPSSLDLHPLSIKVHHQGAALGTCFGRTSKCASIFSLLEICFYLAWGTENASVSTRAHTCTWLLNPLTLRKVSSAASSSSPLMHPFSRKGRTTSVYFFSYFPKASEIKFNTSKNNNSSENIVYFNINWL